MSGWADGGLTTDQAAAALGVSPQRVGFLIRSGRLRATRVGRRWAIDPGALEAVRHRTPGIPKGTRFKRVAMRGPRMRPEA